MDYKTIPIFIISYNRMIVLQKLIQRLEKDGYKNLHIVDNHSDNKDLLSYLNEIDYDVYFMKKNWGHMVVWDSGLFDEVINNMFYVVTDPDLLPIEGCPDDYIKHFYNVLQEYPNKTKVGFSLIIDDIPYTNKYRMDIVRNESFFFDTILCHSPLLFDAKIDTTFALYRPGKIEDFDSGIRTGYPYSARHLDWYMDTNHMSEEEKGYLASGSIYGNSYLHEEKVKKFRLVTLQNMKKHLKNDLKGVHCNILKNFAVQYQRLFLYGAGKIGKETAEMLQEWNISFHGFLVSRKEENDLESIYDHPVYALEEIALNNHTDGIILAMSYSYQLEVLECLYHMGFMNVCYL